MRAVGLALVALALLGAGTASAKPVVRNAILTQTAASATLTGRVLVLEDADRGVVAVADRPSRDSGVLTQREYLRLWRTGGTFRRDHPNAILTGTTAEGARVRVPVVLSSARAVRGALRYTARPLRRTGPLSLTGAALFIDNVGIGFFPQSADVFAPDALVIQPGQDVVVQCGYGPQILDFSELTMGPAATISFPGAGTVEVTVQSSQPIQTLDQILQIGGDSAAADAPYVPGSPQTWVIQGGVITLTAMPQVTLTGVTLACS